MGSGQWHVEKRSTFRNDSFVREYGIVPETGCLSIIVLGASGDLAKKKTFPALFNLYRQVCSISELVHVLESILWLIVLVMVFLVCMMVRDFSIQMKFIFSGMRGLRFLMKS